MAVVLDHPVDDENAEVIHGRPDFGSRFGVTLAKKYPPYVFSIRGASCLVHNVSHVSLHWWRVSHGGRSLVKLKRPVMIATTMCGMSFRLEATKTRTCHVPSDEALLCGRCNGLAHTFGWNGEATKAGIKRTEAHVKLGCAVKGY